MSDASHSKMSLNSILFESVLTYLTLQSVRCNNTLCLGMTNLLVLPSLTSTC